MARLQTLFSLLFETRKSSEDQLTLYLHTNASPWPFCSPNLLSPDTRLLGHERESRLSPKRMRKPSIVSEVIDRGGFGFLGLIRDSPTQVLKYCIPEKEPEVFSLEHEKRTLEILGDHQYITKLLWASEHSLCFDYYPLRSIRRYYESQNSTLPSLHQRYQWCHQFIARISYIHSKNIIHNDLGTQHSSLF